VALFGSLSGYGAMPAVAGQDGTAVDQSAAGQPQSGDAPASTDYNGLDYTRPQQSVQLRAQYRTSFSPTSQTDRDQLFLNLTTKIDLSDGWKLGLQGQLQFVDKQITTLAPPSTTRDAGLGDDFFQAALSHAIDSHWAYGFGARLEAPTAGDSLGSGKWQIMPGFGVRYSFLEINADTYFVPVLRWAVSFAGDPTRRNINEPQFAPTFNISLPDRWFVTLYPSNDIRINYGDPVTGQTGRLFLPLDFMVGRSITKDATVSLEIGVPLIKDYPVYDFKTAARLSIRF
jgi:hypothetical protein